MTSHKLIAVSAAALLGASVGCSKYDASVSGRVTLDGEPLSRGTVAFVPVEDGPPAYGRIDASSNYIVRTGREEGLPSGDYRVTVVANEPPPVENDRGGPPPAGKPITPPWYRSHETSGLEFSVERGSNEIDLRLTTDPPPDWNPRGGARR